MMNAQHIGIMDTVSILENVAHALMDVAVS